jgi:phosphatidylglycerophosphate synthase
MFTPSTFANFLTGVRAIVAILLPLLGFLQGASGVNSAVYLMVVAWISDYFDGVTARSRPGHKPSWLGTHDLQVDMLVAMGLLLYLVQSRYVSLPLAFIYVLAWALIFSRVTMDKTTGSLLQAPIYGIFLWFAAQDAPRAVLLVPAWIIVVLSISWRRFVGQVLPEFFSGLAGLLRRH